MSTISRLAVRNLLRSPRRTVLTVIAVIAGVAISIIGQGFIAGMDESIIVGAIEGNVGHVTARPAGYPTRGGQHPVDVLLALNEPTRQLLASGTVAWTGRTYFAPLAAHGTSSLRVAAIGFDPERDERVFPRTHWKLEGTMPQPGTSEVGVSPQVAKLLGVKPGDSLVLQVRTHRGALNALDVTISGVVRTGNMALDMRGLWVPDTLAAQLIAAEAPSHLSVVLRDRDDAPAFSARLKEALGEQAEVITWQGETEELLALQQVRRNALNLVVFVLLALSAFGIANTILMAAYERIREVGTLRSMGMTEGGVVRLFLLEGGLVGLLGGVVGALAGGGLMVHWARNPIDFSRALEQQGGFAISPLVYTRFDTATTLAALVLAVVVAVVASLYPARVASRMVPADAVRAS